MTVGERIAYLRERKGLSQTQLANKLNVAQSTLAMWEKGKRGLKEDSIKTISEFFGVTADYLLGIENEADGTPETKAQTVAAHIDDDVTDEQMEDIIDYIEYIKQKHAKSE